MKTYDLIICGAGPVGMAAAIQAGRRGLNVLVLEKGATPAPFPRGETARPHEIFEELLGSGFMESISLHRTAGRRINSPGVRKTFEIQRPQRSYIFDWHQFIDRLYERTKELGVDFRFNNEATEPIVTGGSCRGVRLADGEEIHGTTVIDASGHTSKLGRFSGIDYGRINAPMVKCLISNFRGRYRGMQFYFVSQGYLNEAPDFPPFIAFIFPRNADKCEIGLITIPAASRILKIATPTAEETMRVWEIVKQNYPGFSSQLKGSTIDVEAPTGLTMAGLQEEGCLIPGLIHLGDAVGFVEATGGCGLTAGMLSARNAANFIADFTPAKWDPSLQLRYNKMFKSSAIFIHIKRTYRIVLGGLGFVFGRLRTSKRINRHWWLIRLFYSL